MCRIAYVAAVALFLTVGCAEPPVAPDADRAVTGASFSRGASVVRPWKGQASGDSWVGDACGGPGQMILTIAGTGQGTHVGRFEVFASGCYDFTTGQALEAVPGVITAANGDEIKIVLVGFESDPATGRMFSRWSLDGGTGRFADATGEYKAYGVNYPDFTWENTSVGWIAY